MNDTPSSATGVEKTPLEERLIALIRANGPISIADFMADALAHPQDGYYTARQAIGKDGDFITAPEVSQIFGELIGAWMVQTWLELGSPKEFALIELGPGRGVLMEDALRTAALRPDFLSAASFIFVEASGRLRHEQRRRLKAFSSHLHWADDLGEAFDKAPDNAPTILIANEFFDCLPIRQFLRTPEGWRERMITTAHDEDSLVYTTASIPPSPAIPIPPSEGPDSGAPQEGAVFEFCAEGLTHAEKIAKRLIAHKGRALIIDYGRLKSGFGDTLQAVRAHQFWPVLSTPGLADITAHVDFETLAAAAMETGAGVYGPMSQGVLLQNLGLALRLERLCAGKSAEEQASIHAGAHRIAAPSQMGELFKALCISSPDMPPAPGFS